MDKKAMKISVATHNNGYELTVNGASFMYFSEVDLLAGFMSHVGLGETKYMDKGTILCSLMSAMLGEAYTDAVTTLKQRVGLLTSQYNTTIDRMDKSVEYVSQAEGNISGLLNRINALELQLRGTETDFAARKKAVDDLNKKISDVEKKSEKVLSSLSNSATILKAIESVNVKKEAGETVSKDEPDKPRRRSRRAADKTIEEMMKNNPNLK